MCNTLTEELRAHGFQTKIYIVENYDKKADYPNVSLGDDLESGEINGLAMVSTGRLSKFCDELIRRKTPFIDFGGNTHVKEHCYQDHLNFLTSSINYFKKKGMKNIAVMSLGDEDANFQKLKNEELGFDKTYSVTSPIVNQVSQNTDMVNIEEIGFICMNKIIKGKTHPGALVITDDVLAKGATQSLYGAKKNTGPKFPVLTLANSKVKLFYPTKIIKYEYDTDQFIKLAVGQLMKQIDGKEITSLKPFKGGIIKS